MSSKYKHRPRGGKVRVEHFAKPHQRGAGVQGLIDALASRLDGHVIKCVRGEVVA